MGRLWPVSQVFEAAEVREGSRQNLARRRDWPSPDNFNNVNSFMRMTPAKRDPGIPIGELILQVKQFTTCVVARTWSLRVDAPTPPYKI